MRFELNLLATPNVQAGGAGTPLQLPVDAIDEDPLQPRREYDPEALQQLAATIADRGVRQAVSVRSHPDAADRWILNFGSRRLRASKLAGKTEIPAFIDETADSYDQVIENEQREGLRPLELALFVQREIATGQSQAAIAQRLGKSKTFITFVSALIDAPDWLMSVYRAGRCRGITELYELRRLHERAPERVREWLGAHESVTRAGLAALKESLETVPSQQATGPMPVATPVKADTSAGASVGESRTERESRAEQPRARSMPGPRLKRLRLFGLLDGHRVEVVCDRLPDLETDVFVSNGRGGNQSVALSAIGGLQIERA